MNDNIFNHDSHNLFQILEKSHEQIGAGWKEITLKGDFSKIKNIVFAGMGGSAIAGDLLCDFLGTDLRLPFIVNRSYSLPAFCDELTLVIVSSYSGNTEETLACYRDAIEKNCKVIAISTGGEMAEIAAGRGDNLIKLQSGFQPRFALYNSFFTLLRVMQDCGFIDNMDGVVSEISTAMERLAQRYGSRESDAMQLAEILLEKRAIIYSISNLNGSAGMRFKGQLNENGKINAWAGEYPEINHNEIVGWQSNRDNSDLVVFNLCDSACGERIEKRISITTDLISATGVDIINIEGESHNRRVRLFEIIYLCDWISFYLALLEEKNPGDIENIDILKSKMLEE